MRSLLSILFAVVLMIGGQFAFYGCSIWALVEFILYLVKDDPFNWLSVYCAAGSLAAVIVGWLGAMIAGFRST